MKANGILSGLSVVALGALLAGCGASAPKSAQAPSRAAESAPAAPYGASNDAPSTQGYPGGGFEGGASPSPSAAPPASESKAESRQRQGLGTEWGESRSSHVRDVRFVRADEERPFSTSELRYNDRAGIAAVTKGESQSLASLEAGSGFISISVEDGNGDPYDLLRSGGRNFVVGAAGERYAIVIRNHSNHRFETIASVDGLDVLSGQPASFSRRGYVLSGNGTLVIDGFRQSYDSVAAFRFGAVTDSYAAKTGTARNVGVIGVAFFAERGDTPSARELRLRDTANPFPGQQFAAPPRR